MSLEAGHRNKIDKVASKQISKMVSLPYIDNRQDEPKHSNLAKTSTDQNLRGRNNNMPLA